ncbi:glycoside hydrolase family 16 protein [Guyanagaster necrorhizus]|uniref:Glycoside hydrolase family 16 protein n=1 Tax=Guyanagaster necrorhizus TaxID=856835 RepID=A0A9P8AT13_9AGAR|nr:glycoside hydrolase family 16 protein [Guyanagaster necrorhizus MCA 3950]KAG7446496.1 glycoside hydrolase family 16 protein [Guyanagaster necrorhizus MCA 3950]
MSLPRLSRNASSGKWFELSKFDTPYPSYSASQEPLSISKKFSLSPDPQQWGSDLSPDLVEPDDDIHTPKERSDQVEIGGHVISIRGVTNLGCLAMLCAGILALFMGYPVASYVTSRGLSNQGGFNLGGLNASGQVPDIPGNFGLIDLDTPREAYTVSSWNDPSQNMQLVFSDEFNTDGRTFYPGDDPYWEAADLHYWGTNNMEWYDPAAITTKDGSLVVTLSEMETHDLHYQGGMVSTWNKFCFTGGYIETSVMLPGTTNVLGLWPAIWTMGNLGRAGYGATLEGTWPYTYDSCDIGTVANQTINGEPVAATVDGDTGKGGILSYLPGQRLSRCTCPGESHPGPTHPDGTFVGRSAPEIDVFEAQINQDTLIAQVSQSGQWAPFNHAYVWQNTSDNFYVRDPSVSQLNTFMGSVLQQATSIVTDTDTQCYEKTGGCFSIYAFEYKPGYNDGYITWISDNQIAWSIKAAGMGPDLSVEISERPVPTEPMYIITNLGMSTNFGPVDIEHLGFPVHMAIDYIRVYQPIDNINIGCDPRDFPTQAYINEYIEAYMNPNLTTWVDDFQKPFPKNSFLGEC